MRILAIFSSDCFKFFLRHLPWQGFGWSFCGSDATAESQKSEILRGVQNVRDNQRVAANPPRFRPWGKATLKDSEAFNSVCRKNGQNWLLLLCCLTTIFYINESGQRGFEILPAVCQRSHADRAEYLRPGKTLPEGQTGSYPFGCKLIVNLILPNSPLDRSGPVARAIPVSLRDCV